MKAVSLSSFCLASVLVSACATAPKDLVDASKTPVFYNLELTIQDGREEAFLELMQDMVASTKQEGSRRRRGVLNVRSGRVDAVERP